MTENLKTGTTTLGIVFKDGVILGSEHRATMGTMIAHKNVEKVIKIDEHLALTTAGLVGDAQLLARYLSAEAEIYKLRNKEGMSINAAATLMANILSGRKMFPYWVQLLVAGIDSECGHVYSLDAAGGCIEDEYITTGSGSPFAYGVFEDSYKDNMTQNEAVNLAIRALVAATKRDAASGNGISIVVITKKGYELLKMKEIQDRKKKMKISLN